MAEQRHTVDSRDLQLPPIQTWTQAQMDYWEQYVSDLADLLRMAHIELYFEWGKSLDRDAQAQSSPQLKRNRLRCGWSDEFPGEPAEEQRDTAVHELLHYHTARLRQSLEQIEQQLLAPVFQTWVETVDLDEEQLVDTLTRIIAPNLPLPVWPNDSIAAH